MSSPHVKSQVWQCDYTSETTVLSVGSGGSRACCSTSLTKLISSKFRKRPCFKIKVQKGQGYDLVDKVLTVESLDPHHPHKKLGQQPTCNSSAQRQKWGIPGTTPLTRLAESLSSNSRALANKMQSDGGRQEDTQYQPLASTAHTYVYTCAPQYIKQIKQVI